MKKSGFTLSEVLLTLGIIGVVAAMTVPSLMNSTEDKKLSAAAKKAYNTLQNAISQKQALTELTPEDIGATGQAPGLISFLAGTQGDKVPVLKFNAISGELVQLPDGILMTSTTGACGSENNESVGQTGCVVTVDINGEGGPTFSVLNQAQYPKTSSGAVTKQFASVGLAIGASNGYSRANRDIVHFVVDRMNVIPHPGSATAQRYIQGVRKGSS